MRAEEASLHDIEVALLAARGCWPVPVGAHGHREAEVRLLDEARET